MMVGFSFSLSLTLAEEGVGAVASVASISYSISIMMVGFSFSLSLTLAEEGVGAVASVASISYSMSKSISGSISYSISIMVVGFSFSLGLSISLTLAKVNSSGVGISSVASMVNTRNISY